MIRGWDPVARRAIGRELEAPKFRGKSPRLATPFSAFCFCTLSIAYFQGTRRTNHAAFLGHSAERLKKFLYNLDKPPSSVINLGLYDVRSYFMSFNNREVEFYGS